MSVHCYLLFYVCKNFVLPRQLKFKHAAPKKYTINLLINIQNFDRFVAVQVHQGQFLLRLRWI